jgi:heme A synthase
MPKSKPSSHRREVLKRTPSKPSPPRHRSRLRGNRWVTLPLIIGGSLLFISGAIGARTGIVFLPFDPHHVLGQFGGALMLLAGLMLL